jgi:hypothetical protein
MTVKSIVHCETNHPFSLRDDCMDAGGRAKHGAIAEKARMRGYKIRKLTARIHPLSPTLSRRERELIEQPQL